jgi:hypothetical protein
MTHAMGGDFAGWREMLKTVPGERTRKKEMMEHRKVCLGKGVLSDHMLVILTYQTKSYTYTMVSHTSCPFAHIVHCKQMGVNTTNRAVYGMGHRRDRQAWRLTPATLPGCVFRRSLPLIIALLNSENVRGSAPGTLARRIRA